MHVRSSTSSGLRRRAAASLVLSLLAAGAVLALGPASAVTAGDPLDRLPAGAESTAVARVQAMSPEPPTLPAVAVFWRAGVGALGPGDLQAVAGRAAALGLDATAAVERSPDGEVATVAVPLPTGVAGDALVDRVAEVRETVRAGLPAGLEVAVTGPPAFEADVAGAFTGADVTLLLTTAAVVAVLLLLTYRSPVLWIVPLFAVGLADRVALSAVGGLASRFGVAVDEAASGILSVLVFGAGTDYALLLVSRYRDELRRHENRFQAMAATLRATAPAVLASGGTVVLALLTLLVSDVPTTRGLGFASALGVAIAVVAGLLLLPALLVLAGRWVFWPFTPRVGDAVTVDRAGGWARVGRAVVCRPRPVLAAAAVVLGLLAAGALDLRTGLAPADQFRQPPEAVVGQQVLASALPGGSTQPLLVVTRAGAADAVTSAARDTDGIASADVRTVVDGIALVEAVIAAPPGTPASDDAVAALRQRLAAEPSWQARVGGQTAEAYDASAAALRDVQLVVPLTLLVVLLVLVVLLRAVVGPLLLVASVVATWAAALGAGWLLFDRVYGFPALDTGVPLLTFLFLVALGVDYNIFLVTRIREEVLAGRGLSEGAVRALSATGGVITSAGVLLAAVFAVLGVLPVVALTQIGVVVGIGVLLDTLLVRTLVVPALVALTGQRFWWPSRLGREAPVGPASSGPRTPAAAEADALRS